MDRLHSITCGHLYASIKASDLRTLGKELLELQGRTVGVQNNIIQAIRGHLSLQICSIPSPFQKYQEGQVLDASWQMNVWCEHGQLLSSPKYRAFRDKYTFRFHHKWMENNFRLQIIYRQLDLINTGQISFYTCGNETWCGWSLVTNTGTCCLTWIRCPWQRELPIFRAGIQCRLHVGLCPILSTHNNADLFPFPEIYGQTYGQEIFTLGQPCSRTLGVCRVLASQIIFIAWSQPARATQRPNLFQAWKLLINAGNWLFTTCHWSQGLCIHLHCLSLGKNALSGPGAERVGRWSSARH